MVRVGPDDFKAEGKVTKATLSETLVASALIELGEADEGIISTSITVRVITRTKRFRGIRQALFLKVHICGSS